jgi:ABC-type branched-subunit amino acid transport system ATPase component
VSTPPPPFSGPPDGLPRLELTGITKRYPSVVANDGVHLKVGPGEIHAVLGENGAGKSTLMKIIYGAVQADAGQIQWNGREVVIANPSEARRLGIGMVFQHFSLFETLTVVENIALALDEPFDLKRLAARVKEVSTRYGLPLDPDRLVYSLSVGERQRVEIVRCLLQEPQLLILDEPTSVLTPQAVQKLFETLRRLSSEGGQHPLHQPQAARDPEPVPQRHRDARRQGHRHRHPVPGDAGQPGAHDDRPRAAGVRGARLHRRGDTGPQRPRPVPYP